MTSNIDDIKYIPGTYAKKRPHVSIKEPRWAAEIVTRAYKEKFASEISQNNKTRR